MSSPQPSTSASCSNKPNLKKLLKHNSNSDAKNEDDESKDNENEQLEDREMSEMLTAEEFLVKRGWPMLPYQKQMFLDICYSDGLVVCAKGLDYNAVVLNLLKAHSDPANLLFVINSADYEEKYFKSKLDANEVHESSTNANEREQVYLLGGIQFLTTRIFVVDLLKKRIPIELITGIIVLRANQIIESCQEAFALRLYRQSNKTGFVKAFTHTAESFTFGYGQVEKVMRNIFVKELFIWPRFHATVQKSLKPFEPQIIELHIPMTQKMISIQSYILDIMNFLVKELKRINPFVDMQEISVENCVTKKFHKILQAQLDCVWHQLSTQTKVLIADLKVLRSLMISTIYNDSVSFYVTLKKYRTTEYAMNNSGWILLDAAEQIFKLGKERVFNRDEEFEPELCPKWKVLSEILRVEIPSDIKRSIDHKPHILNEPIKVLVLCQDSRTAYQLNQYLINGGERHLFYTAIKNDLNVSKISENYKLMQEADAVNSVKLQSSDAFSAKAKIVQKQTAGPVELAESTIKSMFTTKQPERPKKEADKPRFIRDRIAKRKEAEDEELGKDENEDGDVAATDKDELSLFAKDDVVNDYLYRDTYVLRMTQPNESGTRVAKTNGDSDLFDVTQMENAAFETFLEMENLNVTQLLSTTTKPIVCIQTFKSGEDGVLALDRTLDEMNPGFVIMYHCNITAIRQIEVYEAKKQRLARDRLKVFFLIHAQTVEEQSYLTSLRREKQSFELLIDLKSKMVVPEYQDGKSDDSMLLRQKSGVDTEAGVDTRQAGGQIETAKTLVVPKIIVDMREFRSDLPCLIHKRGIEVVPVTITIGDYILTPEICVERKSISDLIGSLNSGRMYNQCVAMTRHYKKPILLIEFDQNKPFHLQGHYVISGESSSNVDITKKLQLLTIHFPKLRLVWSPSPYATAQLFEEIKQNREEPDGTAAAALGMSESGGKELQNIVDKINPNVHDFLLKLPGINSRNITMLMKSVKNLKELLGLSEDDLGKILASQANAKMLYEILHVAHKPVQSDDKQFPSKFKRTAGRGGFRRF